MVVEMDRNLPVHSVFEHFLNGFRENMSNSDLNGFHIKHRKVAQIQMKLAECHHGFPGARSLADSDATSLFQVPQIYVF